MEPFDLRDAIEKTVKTIKPLVEKKGLALEIIITPEVATMTSDRRRVKQALLNLLSNAVKFTEKGAISITCQTIGKELTISVKDTGIGIKLEEMDSLFKPFHLSERNRAAVRRHGPGSFDLQAARRAFRRAR